MDKAIQRVFSTSFIDFPALVMILGAFQYYFMWLVIMEFNARNESVTQNF